MKAPLSVVVLMKNSLFAGGIASRLQENGEIFQTVLLDAADQAEMLLQLLHLDPVIIIVDALDKYLFEQLPLIELLETFPKTRIVQVNCINDDVHVFTSEEWHPHKTDELFSKMLEIVS
jgi:DNA-binding NarL/FixJ family response regulator